MEKRVTARRAMHRKSAFPWRQRVLDSLRAASRAVRLLAPRAGQRVVAGREAGYRPWDPEVIAVREKFMGHSPYISGEEVKRIYERRAVEWKPLIETIMKSKQVSK